MLKTTLFAIWVLVLVSACAAQNKSRRITAIQAKLFYENTGAFSENVLTEKGADLWNSPFDATYSTFVIVEVENLPSYLKKYVEIELIARYRPVGGAKRRLTFRQTNRIYNGSENGKGYVGFWLKATGCYGVRLVARIVGQKRSFRKTIGFGCGE